MEHLGNWNGIFYNLTVEDSQSQLVFNVNVVQKSALLQF